MSPAGDGGYLTLATVEAYNPAERNNASDGKRPISEAIKTDSGGLLQWSVPLRCGEAAVDRGSGMDKWLLNYYHSLGGGTLYRYTVASPGGGYPVTGIDEGSHPALVKFADTGSPASSPAVADNGGSGGLPWLYIATLVVVLAIAAGVLIYFKNRQKGKK